MATIETSSPSTSEVQGPITAEKFLEMAAGYDVPVELIRGEIIEMTQPKPPHGTICGLIFSSLIAWAKAHDAGLPSMADGVLLANSPDTVRAPDVFFTAKDMLPNGKAPNQWYEVAPKLCVEVISDSETWHDIQIRIEEYFTFGVSEVWIVDQQLKSLLAFSSPNHSKKYTGNNLIESPNLPGFSVPLSDFFYGC